jgi:hypothetical protein
VWWRDIVSIWYGGGSVLGNWFPDNLCLHVGNGANTFFWLDRWLGMSLFAFGFAGCTIYSMINCVQRQMFAWGWDV